MQITKEQIEKLLEADIAKNGPFLLWYGYGKIPGNFRGLTPRTFAGYLKFIRREFREKPTGEGSR